MQTETINSLMFTCLHRIFPHWAQEKKRIEARSISVEVSIKSYSEMSQRIQCEIENNHFAPYLQYEKKISE